MGPNSPGKAPVAEKHKPIPKPNQSNLTDFPSLASTARLTKKEIRNRTRKIKLQLEQLKLMQLAKSDPEEEDEDDMETESPEAQPETQSGVVTDGKENTEAVEEVTAEAAVEAENGNKTKDDDANEEGVEMTDVDK